MNTQAGCDAKCRNPSPHTLLNNSLTNELEAVQGICHGKANHETDILELPLPPLLRLPYHDKFRVVIVSLAYS